MKALLVDPVAREVTEIEYPAKLEGLYELIGTDNLDHAVLLRTADGQALCGFCDGAGYYKPQLKWARFTFYEHPVAGRAVVYQSDESGETVDCAMSAERLASMVQWLDARPTDLAPASVTTSDGREIRVDFNAADAPKTVEETYERLFGDKPPAPRA